MIKKCLQCNKEFLKPLYLSKNNWSKTKFCSKKCFGKSIENHAILNCKICNKTFIAYGQRKNTAEFCSMKCKGIASRKRVVLKCKECNKNFLLPISRLKFKNGITFCSRKCFKKQPNRYWLGKKRPEMSKEYNHNWKNGITSINEQVRKSLEYKTWRNKVFKRDNYTCQNCGKRGLEINADHIEAFSMILTKHEIDTVEKAFICVDLWDISNGRTLCISCHKKTKTYGWKSVKLLKKMEK